MLFRYFAHNRIRMSQLSAVAVFALLAISDTRWEQTLTEATLFLIGAILVGIATVGRCWCLLYIVGFKNATLITVGPYSMTRHPLYFFTMIGAIGVGFATETFTFAALFGLWFWLFYPHVIRAEEQRLAGLHGADFEEYRQRVPRFWPRLRGGSLNLKATWYVPSSSVSAWWRRCGTCGCSAYWNSSRRCIARFPRQRFCIGTSA